MKRILFAIFLLWAVSADVQAQGVYTPSDVPNVHVSDRTQYVSDPDGLLTAAVTDSLNRALGRIWSETSAEPILAVISSMASGYDINTFATELFSLWEIGKKDRDNGLLILVAIDDRRMAIRTGYGLEGVLPDGVCGRIRDRAFVDFRRGEYGRGLETAVAMISDILLRPDAREEILSAYANDSRRSGDNDFDFLKLMLAFGCVALAVMLLLIAYTYRSTRNLTDAERYSRLLPLKYVSLFLTFLGLGVPVVAWLVCRGVMDHVRNHKRACPNCDHPMHKVDEVHDNDYLTPSQDLEEKLNSVDYDVWLCDNCGETDITPYRNRQSGYSVCPQCGAQTLAPAGDRIIQQPTAYREGRGEHLFVCRNCRSRISRPYTIAKLAPPVVILPGGGRGGGGGGGGISGGSFGGGMTGGGGASGGW